jgi:hypothetical protein
MAQKTAMQKLLYQLRDERRNIPMNIEWDRCYQAIEAVIENIYLQEEMEQIINFANCFYDDCITEGGSLKQSAEQYYNQTYNQNK